MCGRFTLTAADVASIAHALGVQVEDLGAAYQPRYNLAPTDPHFVVRNKHEEREVVPARWGLVRYGAKDRKQAARGINARAESVDTRPLFREAFKKRRCIVPADGYYEWTGTKENRQPFWFHRPNGELMTFAGLYEWWQPQPAEWEATFTIVTCPPNAITGQIHDRMPVILPEERVDDWIFAGEEDVDTLKSLLVPAPEPYLVSRPVSRRVNSVKNDTPDLITELTDPTTGELPAESGQQLGLFKGS